MYEIHELVMHEDKMCLLDRVVDSGDDFCVAALTIRTDDLFCGKQGVPVWIGIEYMAQTVAAFAGLEGKRNGRDPEIGMLVRCRDYRPTQQIFPIGQALTIRCDEDFRDENIGVYQCQILDESKNLIASASLSAYIPDDIHQLIGA